jgi:AcrR family transcriptional regulator
LIWYTQGVDQKAGLRERKKNKTWLLLRQTALDLFEERGFENVSVAEIAAAADVSKATVFNYFPSKEDLAIGGMKRHTGDAARIVRARPRGQTPLEALREHYFHLLECHAPQVGLSDSPQFLQVQRLIMTTPSLRVAAMDYRRQSAVELAEALIEEDDRLTARLLASQLLHTQHILAEVNVVRILEGEPIDQVRAEAFTAARHAFGLLEHGIGDLMRRETDPPADAVFGREFQGIHYAPGECEAREAAEKVLAEPVEDMLQTLADPGRP